MPRKTMAQMEQENVSLSKKVDKLNRDVEGRDELDKEIRENITRILRGTSGHEEQERFGFSIGARAGFVYTWLEICAEIGKLKAARTFYDYEGNISEMDEAIKRIIKDLRGEKENCNRDCRC